MKKIIRENITQEKYNARLIKIIYMSICHMTRKLIVICIILLSKKGNYNNIIYSICIILLSKKGNYNNIIYSIYIILLSKKENNNNFFSLISRQIIKKTAYYINNFLVKKISKNEFIIQLH